MSMVTITTSRFGNIEVDDSLILNFTSPILGFDQLKQFVILDHADESPFKWLQSVEMPELAFVITNPQFFGINYEFSLPEDACQKLELTQAEDALVVNIVNIPADNPKAMTANLLGPIVINQSNRLAMQVILNDSEFSTKTPLVNENEDDEGNNASDDEKVVPLHSKP